MPAPKFSLPWWPPNHPTGAFGVSITAFAHGGHVPCSMAVFIRWRRPTPTPRCSATSPPAGSRPACSCTTCTPCRYSSSTKGLAGTRGREGREEASSVEHAVEVGLLPRCGPNQRRACSFSNGRVTSDRVRSHPWRERIDTLRTYIHTYNHHPLVFFLSLRPFAESVLPPRKRHRVPADQYPSPHRRAQEERRRVSALLEHVPVFFFFCQLRRWRRAARSV